MDNFFYSDKIEKNVLNDKTSRQVLAHDKDLMVCHLYFKEGAVGAPHQHPHSQIAYAISGKYEFTLEGKTSVLNPGDSVYVPSNVIHGLVCLETGEFLDIFTPEREDFLK